MIKRIITLIIIALSFAGCKMNYSFTGASIPAGAKTVSIETFQNMAPQINPLLSNTLTEALKDKFMSQTSLQLVQRDGDLQFSGTITGYEIRPVSIQADDVAAQNRFTITVKVKFVNKLDPKTDFDNPFARYWDYESDQDFSSNESSYVEIVVEDLVQDIFNKAVVNW